MIKTPVKLSEWGDLIAGGELLAQGFGPRRVEEMCEIRDALNERAALLEQRGALKRVCESVLESLDIALEILRSAGGEVAADVVNGAFVGVRAEIRAGLALVEAETQEEGE
jgi:hypothetical protein